METQHDKEMEKGVSGRKWVFFVTGATACGKTTVAKYIAQEMGLEYIEGDDYHPKANVTKMAKGESLNSEDRRGWLEALRREAEHPRGGNLHVVVTCSALKREYRDMLRGTSHDTQGILLQFIYLDAPEAILRERAAERKGHFAGANLVHGQFEALEPPESDETDVTIVDASHSIEETERDALASVRRLVQG